MRRWRITLVALLVVAAACSGEGDDDGAPPGPDDPTTTTEAAADGELWSIDLPVIGPAEAAGDVAVVYVAEGTGIDLVGVDAATGEQLWSHPAGPGFVPPGIPVGPAVVPGPDGEPLVAYFRPVGRDLTSEVVVVDPATGDEVAVTDPVLSTDPLDSCDDGTDVCTRTSSGDGEQGPRLRLDLGTGAVTPEPGPLAENRPLADHGLTDLRTGGVEYLAQVDGAEVRWSVPVRDVFGPGWSTNGGWAFDHDADDGLFVGSIGSPPPDDVDAAYEGDLAEEETVAIDDADGSVAWSDEGAAVWCASDLATPEPLVGDADAAGLPIRCRTTGTVAVPAEGEATFRDVAITIERFDRVSGETEWAVPVGDTRGLFGGGDEVSAVVDERTILVAAENGPVTIDLVDGTSGAPEDDLVAACASEPVTFEAPPWYPAGRDEPITERTGGTLVVPCGPDLDPVDAPLTRTLVEAVGVPVADALVVATDGRLAGFPAT